MFIAGLFTIAKTWEQPKCPLMDEDIVKIHTHTHTQWNIIRPYITEEILSFATIWMDLEGIMLSEIKQRQKNTV